MRVQGPEARGQGPAAISCGGRPFRRATLAPLKSCLTLVLLSITVVAALSAQTKPTRIVSLIPAVTEMLFAIGAGPQVVGVSTFDTFPEEATTRTKVGGLFDPNFEAILTLRPDLAIVYGSQEELIERLERVRIPMFRYRHGGLTDITRTIRDLGQRTGQTSEADRLANQIDAQIRTIRTRASGVSQPRTLLVFGREEASMRGLYVSGGVGFLHDMLEAAGGVNVMADVKREGLQLSLEQLLSRAPEVVIELRASVGWSADRRAREAAVWTAVGVPAARNGRVRFLQGDAMTIPGPRVGWAVQALFDALRHSVPVR